MHLHLASHRSRLSRALSVSGLCAGVSLVAVAGTASGHAGARAAVACPNFHAHVTSGQIGLVNFDQNGQATTPTAVHGDLHRESPYVAMSRATFVYGGNQYRVKHGTQFALGCYGQSVNTPNILYPSVALGAGQATVKTVAWTPGAISTLEALMNPVGHTAQTINVGVKGYPTNGTVTMSSTGPLVDITPEYNPNAGHCIYHHAIVIHSRWSQKAGEPLLSVKVLS